MLDIHEKTIIKYFSCPYNRTLSPTTVMTGVTAPELVTSVTSPVTDQVTGLPDVMTSNMTVTPDSPGRHTACVDIVQSG